MKKIGNQANIRLPWVESHHQDACLNFDSSKLSLTIPMRLRRIVSLFENAFLFNLLLRFRQLHHDSDPSIAQYRPHALISVALSQCSPRSRLKSIAQFWNITCSAPSTIFFFIFHFWNIIDYGLFVLTSFIRSWFV